MGKEAKKEEKASVPAVVESKLPALSNSFLDRISKMPTYLASAAPPFTPFSEIAEFLRIQGIPAGHLKPAILTLLVLNSAHLGNPFAMEMFENEEKTGEEILRICHPLVPDTFRIEFPQIIPQVLMDARNLLKGRTIIGMNSATLKKASSDLNSLLVRQNITFLQTPKGGRPQKITINGPIGFFSIAKDPKDSVLTHPSFLKIYLRSGEPLVDPSRIFKESSATVAQKCQFMILLNRFKTSFKRLQPQPVSIPYQNPIFDCLTKAKSSSKVDTFLKLIRIITIINNSPPESKEENWANAYGMDLKLIREAEGSAVAQQTPLIAGKVDYYIFWVLMSGMIENEEVHLTDRQKRIFAVIKKHNLKALRDYVDDQSRTVAKNLNEIEVAYLGWADQGRILDYVNQDGGEQILKKGTLYNELKELEDKGFIRGKKVPGASNKDGFYVTTLEIPDTVPLPHPSEIEDPVTGKGKIKVINPITNMVDEV